MAKGNSCTPMSLSQLYNVVKPLFSGVRISGDLELIAFGEEGFAKMLCKAAKAGDLRCTTIKGEPVLIEAFANTDMKKDSKVIVKIPMVTKENVTEWLSGAPDAGSVRTTHMPGLEKYLQSSDDRWFKLIDGLINHPLTEKLVMMLDMKLDQEIHDTMSQPAEDDPDYEEKLHGAIKDAQDLGTDIAEEHAGFNKVD